MNEWRWRQRQPWHGRRQTRPRGPARAAALAAFLTSTDAPAAGGLNTRLAALGLTVDARYRVVLGAPAIGASGLQRVLAPFGQVHEAAIVDGALAAVVEDRVDVSASRVSNDDLRAPGRSVTQSRDLTGPPIWLALSASARGADGLRLAARQARYLAALLGQGLVRGPIARFDSLADVGVFRLLYGYWGGAEIERFASEALGDLPERDRRGVLRRTLLAYLDSGGSHVESAARLEIHRNTLSYRLKQIAMLTSHDPADPSCRLLLHLALLAAELPPAPD